MSVREEGIRGFYITGWKSGKHIFSRTWLESEYDSILLSALITSLETIALSLTTEQVNLVTLEDSRFFFKFDKNNQLLFILITGLSKGTIRYRSYLEYMSKYFTERFDPLLKDTEAPILLLEEGIQEKIASAVDTFVENWERAESDLAEVKIQDVLDVYSLFYNTIIMKCLDEDTRNNSWNYIQKLFKEHPLSSGSFDYLSVDPPGFVNYDELGLSALNYDFMLKRLNRILKGLVLLSKRTRSQEHYQDAFFKHVVPVIRLEHQRLKTYQLNDLLVVHLL
jgi:hypothetical protein